MSQATSEPEQVIADLRTRLDRTPRASRPLEHAALRYQLGLAYAELPTGDRELNLSRAIASYEHAADLFSQQHYPVEHARVQNARGAALRELGSPQDAANACATAVELLTDGGAPGERGAALNNLGLAYTDLDRHENAIAVLRRAIDAFEEAGENRQQAMARHNLGQAQAAAGEHEAAAASYEQALGELDVEQAPYQWAMIQHALGVSLSAIERGQEAAAAFAAALGVFTRQRYPFQYALAKNNYGLAWAQVGGLEGLRRALASYEDALRVLDVRMHRPQWQQAYRNLEMAEAALSDLGTAVSRPEHFAALVGGLEDDAERITLLRERMEAFFELPDKQRDDGLAELSLAATGLPEQELERFTMAWLNVLMELPNDNLVQGLRARLSAHAGADAETAETANRVLDQVVQEELLSPQRMRVRDTLEMLGWERP